MSTRTLQDLLNEARNFETTVRVGGKKGVKIRVCRPSMEVALPLLEREDSKKGVSAAIDVILACCPEVTTREDAYLLTTMEGGLDLSRACFHTLTDVSEAKDEEKDPTLQLLGD